MAKTTWKRRRLLRIVLCLLGAIGTGCHEIASSGSVEQNVREFVEEFARELAAAFLV